MAGFKQFVDGGMRFAHTRIKTVYAVDDEMGKRKNAADIVQMYPGNIGKPDEFYAFFRIVPDPFLHAGHLVAENAVPDVEKLRFHKTVSGCPAEDGEPFCFLHASAFEFTERVGNLFRESVGSEPERPERPFRMQGDTYIPDVESNSNRFFHAENSSCYLVKRR